MSIVHVLWFQTLDSFRQHLHNLSPKSSRHFQNSQHPCNSFRQLFPHPFKFLTYSVLHPATCLPQHVSVLDQKQHCSRRSVRYSQCLITARFECLSRPPQDLRLKTQWTRFPSARLFFRCVQTLPYSNNSSNSCLNHSNSYSYSITYFAKFYCNLLS